MQGAPLLAEVDLLAAEEVVAVLWDAALGGQAEKRVQDLFVEEVLGEVEEHLAVGRGQCLAFFWAACERGREREQSDMGWRNFKGEKDGELWD